MGQIGVINMTEKVGLLHDQEYLKGLAKQLRIEADRAEARAEKLTSGEMEVGCASGCWNILSTCIKIQEL